MVIDTSAVLAWLKQESERERIVAALEAHPVCRISAVSLLEAHVVVRAREHPTMLGKLQRFLEEISAVVMPFDERQARLADAAFQRYGQGQGHPAQLNLGRLRGVGPSTLYRDLPAARHSAQGIGG